MGLGSTAKNVQKLADLAEKLYKQVNEVLKRVASLQEDVEEATDDVQAVRREQREQRAILEALADEQGVDVGAVLDDADLEPPEPAEGDEESADEGGDQQADADGSATADAS